MVTFWGILFLFSCVDSDIPSNYSKRFIVTHKNAFKKKLHMDWKSLFSVARDHLFLFCTMNIVQHTVKYTKLFHNNLFVLIILVPFFH